MSYKLDKKKSLSFGKILIGLGLVAAIYNGVQNGLTILSQNQGVEKNNTAIEQVINDTPAQTLENEEETYIPKYDVFELQSKYPNAWGILEKPDGTAFPIVSTNSRDEEDYYLSHSIDGEYSVAGTVFVDYQNDKDMNNQVTRIWGHNTFAENMFGDLTEYKNQGQSFYDQNKTYTLYTAKGVYELDVFAALEENGTIQEFEYENQDEFLKDMYNNINSSNFTSDVTLSPDDQVIIFACCPDKSTTKSQDIKFSVYSKVVPIYEYNLNNSKTM